MSKNLHFSNRVNPWFWSKNGHFSNVFFQATQARKICFTIFQKKKTPVQPLKQNVEKVEKLTFFQMGCLMVLVQKWPLFQLFFFQNIVPEKFFYGIVQRKNAVLGYENKKFKKLKNSHFSKVVNRWFWSKNGHSFKPFFFAIQGSKMSFTIFYNEKLLSRL